MTEQEPATTDPPIYRFNGHFYQGATKSPDNTVFAHYFIDEPTLEDALSRARKFTDNNVDVDLNSAVAVDRHTLQPIRPKEDD
jgi:hypothetical protein